MAVHGKTGYVTLSGTTICVTSWSINRSLEEVDVTTTCSDGNYKEYIAGFSEATGSFTKLSIGAADHFGATGEAVFGNDDCTMSGTILVTGADSSNDVNNRFETTYNFRFTGPVTVAE